MGSLKVNLLSNGKVPGKSQYKNKVNSENYKEISLVLNDLNNLGLPIEKAIKDFNLKKSDWEAALRF